MLQVNREASCAATNARDGQKLQLELIDIDGATDCCSVATIMQNTGDMSLPTSEAFTREPAIMCSTLVLPRPSCHDQTGRSG